MKSDVGGRPSWIGQKVACAALPWTLSPRYKQQDECPAETKVQSIHALYVYSAQSCALGRFRPQRFWSAQMSRVRYLRALLTQFQDTTNGTMLVPRS